ncbi:hypothetical protein [Natrinema salsiterrestre]|nr:hypothetical protein [Natrinema salsiterrestre]
MNELIDAAVLATETELPMSAVGWGTLLLAVAVTTAWAASLYR